MTVGMRTRAKWLLSVIVLATGVIAALLAVLPHMLLGNASVPVGGLLAMLGLVLVIGFVSGLAAVRATLSAPLLTALRNN